MKSHHSPLKILVIILLPLLFGLAACSGEVFDRAYTASGDGMSEYELTPDEQFTPTDDLNVVIKLNKHDDPVKVGVRFIDPNGEILQEQIEEASNQVGTVVIGIDYESRNDLPNQWVVGRYRAEVLIDGDVVKTLFFRVD